VRELLPIQCLLPVKHKDENKAPRSRDSFTPPLCNEKSLLGGRHHQEVTMLLRQDKKCPAEQGEDVPAPD